MLPSHTTDRLPGIKNYTIRSSDVLDQSMRITVEADGVPLWVMTRDLTETEIVDYVTDAKANEIRWTIHQPKRGWYLRIRAPSFPPGVCIALLPVQNNSTAAPSSSQVFDPKLTFGCQTLVPSPQIPIPDHSYPPSRASTSSQSSVPTTPVNRSVDAGPTPASAENPGEESSKSSPPPAVAQRTFLPQRPAVKPEWHITHYNLHRGLPEGGPLSDIHHHPHLVTQPSHAPHSSILHRALAPLSKLANGNGSIHHFTISPVEGGSSPLVVFTDSTPILKATPSGTLSVDVDALRMLGVDIAFWIAVSLAFLGFLKDRDGYLAASEF